jgi:hypothetical protein
MSLSILVFGHSLSDHKTIKVFNQSVGRDRSRNNMGLAKQSPNSWPLGPAWYSYRLTPFSNHSELYSGLKDDKMTQDYPACIGHNPETFNANSYSSPSRLFHDQC